MESHISKFRLASERLAHLRAHDALTLLRHSLSAPRLLYNLRSTDCAGHPSLQAFDDLLRGCLVQALNVSLDDTQWDQAALPIKWGGLGIRRTVQLAPSAYLASAAASVQLVSAILPIRMGGISDPHRDHALSVWTSLGGSNHPTGLAMNSQKAWDGPIVRHVFDRVFSMAQDDYTRARLLAVSAPHAGDWLVAPLYHQWVFD